MALPGTLYRIALSGSELINPEIREYLIRYYFEGSTFPDMRYCLEGKVKKDLSCTDDNLMRSTLSMARPGKREALSRFLLRPQFHITSAWRSGSGQEKVVSNGDGIPEVDISALVAAYLEETIPGGAAFWFEQTRNTNPLSAPFFAIGARMLSGLKALYPAEANGLPDDSALARKLILHHLKQEAAIGQGQ